MELLGGVCSRFNWICRTYCQTSNHCHMVVETPKGNLSHGMRQLNGCIPSKRVYTQYVNRTHRREVTSFKIVTRVLVEKDNYFLELARYGVLNPVRADMVSDPGVAATGRWWARA